MKNKVFKISSVMFLIIIFIIGCSNQKEDTTNEPKKEFKDLFLYSIENIDYRIYDINVFSNNDNNSDNYEIITLYGDNSCTFYKKVKTYSETYNYAETERCNYYIDGNILTVKGYFKKIITYNSVNESYTDDGLRYNKQEVFTYNIDDHFKYIEKEGVRYYNSTYKNYLNKKIEKVYFEPYKKDDYYTDTFLSIGSYCDTYPNDKNIDCNKYIINIEDYKVIDVSDIDKFVAEDKYSKTIDMPYPRRVFADIIERKDNSGWLQYYFYINFNSDNTCSTKGRQQGLEKYGEVRYEKVAYDNCTYKIITENNNMYIIMNYDYIDEDGIKYNTNMKLKIDYSDKEQLVLVNSAHAWIFK